jgi:hypothetical protein
MERRTRLPDKELDVAELRSEVCDSKPPTDCLFELGYDCNISKPYLRFQSFGRSITFLPDFNESI